MRLAWGATRLSEARGCLVIRARANHPENAKEHQIQQFVRILPWLALGCAFSPMLIQLANVIPEDPFGWSVLLAPALMLAAALRGSGEAHPRRGWAQILLIAGLLIELVGLSGGSPAVARLGLPMSVVGLSLWTGAPPLMTSLLAFWVIPIPITVYGLTTPNLESAYAQFGAAAISALGADLSVSGPVIRSGAEHLELDPYHSGIHLVFVVTLLTWYASVRNGLTPIAALARTAGAALVAVPLQILAVLVAIALLVADSPDLANFWLDDGAWLLTAILGIVWIETR